MWKTRDPLVKKKSKQTLCKCCQGKGVVLKLIHHTEPCMSCRGTGKIRNATCFVCGGKGTQLVTQTQLCKCESCKGTGWMATESAYASG